MPASLIVVLLGSLIVGFLNLNVLKFFTISKEQLGLILQGKIQNIEPEEYNCFNLENISKTDIEILKKQYLKLVNICAMKDMIY